MGKIQRYINGLVATNECNLDCNYCYLKLQNYGLEQKTCEHKYDIAYIKRAMSVERWGICYISLCGKGETLIDKWVVDLACALLEAGHYINIINNGTMTQNLKYMRESFSHEQAERTMLTFSFHYTEMKRKNILEEYLNNVKTMKENGFTVYIHLTLADEYIPYLNEIKELCIEKTGIVPQLGIVRDESDRTKEEVLTKESMERYFKLAEPFHSPYFELSRRLYEDQCVTKYCYAGELGVLLDFSTGYMKQCLCNNVGYNVFEHIDRPVSFSRVGLGCEAPWCYNPALQIFGLIPGQDYPYFSDIFAGERKDCTSEIMIDALDTKLADDYVKAHPEKHEV